MYTSFVEKELKKCLLCKNARCLKCPANTQIPEIISLVKNNDFKRAGALLFNNNPLSAITGEVCPNHLYCRAGCVLGVKGSAVDFSHIEQKISREFLNLTHKEIFKLLNNIESPQTVTKKNIAIVGSGPAGLSGAYFLIKQGHSVTIYEQNDDFGGMLRYGIPNFRLDKIYINKIINVLKALGVEFKRNIKVDINDIESLKNQNDYDVIILAIGANIGRTLDIYGNEHTITAVDYLKNPQQYHQRLESKKEIKNVIVIGAGNVAIDCATTASTLMKQSKYFNEDKHGFSITQPIINLCYRKDETAMKAYPHELELARKLNVAFHYFMIPKEVREINGSLEVDFDCEGRVVTMNADLVITAIGQYAIENTKNSLEITDWGSIQVINSKTNIDGVYAIGDAVTGTSTIIKAVASAKELVKSLLN